MLKDRRKQFRSAYVTWEVEVVEPACKGDKQPGQVNSKDMFQLSE